MSAIRSGRITKSFRSMPEPTATTKSEPSWLAWSQQKEWQRDTATAGFSGVCGVCGVSLEALMREKIVSWVKLYFLTVEGLKETPLIPQTPQPPLLRRPGLRASKWAAADTHTPKRRPVMVTAPGLIPSALANAAILLRGRPAALRLLCVMSAHMDANGSCRVRQRAIAKRLGISLQAANKQFKFLETGGFLASTEIKIGLSKSYSLRAPDLQPSEVAAYGGI